MALFVGINRQAVKKASGDSTPFLRMTAEIATAQTFVLVFARVENRPWRRKTFYTE
jgi:hypothetical protein